MRKYLYIGIGGAIGAISRYLFGEIHIEQYQGIIPINTLIINFSGCFILALILTAALEMIEFSSNLRLGITTGLLGAFTTFSTLCKETVVLIQQGSYFSAISYVVISAVLGFLAIYLGIAFAREIVVRKKINSFPDKREEK